MKTELRKQFRASRRDFVRNHSPEKLRAELGQSLKQNVPFQGREFWAIYRPQSSEADPCWLIEHCPTVSWCFPVVESNNLNFYFPGPDTPWKVNAYGIWEPVAAESRFIEPDLIKGVIVPGIAFDLRGARLGSGKGYYDRFFQKYQGLKVGLAFSVQISTHELPTEPHDGLIDMLVTEKDIYRFNERKSKHG